MRRLTISAFTTMALLPLLAAGAGNLLGGGVLHPRVRPLTPEQIAEADRMLASVGARRLDTEVRAPDGILLRGWKVFASPTASDPPNRGDWVLLFHGVSDNRVGMLGHAEFLLRHGYSVVMMDARAHGASEGRMATYGLKERDDTRAIVDALYASERVEQLFALGESMGAAIALQSAAIEPRIAGVVAESAFSNFREASYDYAGLNLSPWLGRTLFRPAAIVALRAVEKEGGFQAQEISPEQSVAARAFPVLLICGTRDHKVPPRHSRRIYQAARGRRELWLAPGAAHAAALGKSPAEFERRVLTFYKSLDDQAARTPK